MASVTTAHSPCRPRGLAAEKTGSTPRPRPPSFAVEGKKSNSQAAMQTFGSSRPDGRRAGARDRARGLRVRARLRQGARAVRQEDHRNQAIAFTLARMKLEIDAARLLVWRASWMGRNGVPFENAEGSMSKLKSGEVAVWVTGARDADPRRNGYTREFPVEALHRDAKIYDNLRGHRRDPAARIARAISGCTSNRMLAIGLRSMLHASGSAGRLQWRPRRRAPSSQDVIATHAFTRRTMRSPRERGP